MLLMYRQQGSGAFISFMTKEGPRKGSKIKVTKKMTAVMC